MMKRCLMLSALVVNGFCAVQAQYKAEYFYDADPGYGNAVQTSIDIGANDLLLSTENLSEGFHLLSIRSVDAEGRWSSTVSHPVLVTNDLVYAGAEYFVDTDPGKGKGVNISVTDRKVLSFFVKTDNLALGTHNLSVRIQHIDGTWSDVVTRAFVVVERQAETGFTLEYFYDADPGYGNAKRVAVNEGLNSVYLSTDGLSEGMHLMSMRCLDKESRWSSVVSSPIYVVNTQEFDSMEWFVDTDPGEGNANHLTLGGGVINFSVPTNLLSVGSHTLVLRARIAGNGNWVVISETPFSVVEDTGVASVTIDMDVKISHEDGKLHLASSELMEATVEVFSIDGKKLLDKQWDRETNEMTINVSNYASTLIIKVQRKDGKRFIRKISQ